MPAIEDYNKRCPCSKEFDYRPKLNKFPKLSSMHCEVMGLKLTLPICLFLWELLSHATMTDLEAVHSAAG